MDYFFRRISSAFGVFFRTVRALFLRTASSVRDRLGKLVSFSRRATKAAGDSVQEVTAAMQKPTKREDYIETSRLFISKSFIAFAVIGAILLGLFCYYIAWPFILSHFLTARFYVEDDRVENWTGQVIVYADRDKTIPMYSGRLEDGLLEGQGKEYDGEGRVSYEGPFVAGVRSGIGRSYKEGVLLYEGGFEENKYQGSGTLYENGLAVYQGRFSEGLFEGPGTAWSDGARIYEGSFSKGLYNGQGTEYYPNGEAMYKGGFADGKFDGTGTLYRQDGSVLYTGGFADGKYNGQGAVYLENGDRIESEFVNGSGGDRIRWYIDGELWYEGGADDLTPDGFGTVYAPSGKAIYKGAMDRGSIDGQWLLSLKADDLREAFCEASVSETKRNGGGFLMINNDLGLTVLSTYRTDEGDPGAFRGWLSPEGAALRLLPWQTREEAEVWAENVGDKLINSDRSHGTIYVPGGGVAGDFAQSVFFYEGHNMSLICPEEESPPFMIVWAVIGGLDAPEVTAVDGALSSAQQTVGGLAEALNKMGIDVPATVGGGGSTGKKKPPANVTAMLYAVKDLDEGRSLMDALINACAYDQAAAALGASRPLLELMLEEQRTRYSRGLADETAVSDAAAAVEDLDHRLNQLDIMLRQARVTAEGLTEVNVEDRDLTAVMLATDLSKLKADDLYNAAIQYATDLAAGRYEVDASAVITEVKLKTLDLTMAYDRLTQARSALDRSAEALTRATDAYATGEVGRSELYSAQCGVNDAVASLFQAVASCSGAFNSLNTLSGGWLAGKYSWYPGPFAALRDASVAEAVAEAEENAIQDPWIDEYPEDPAAPGEAVPGDMTW